MNRSKIFPAKFSGNCACCGKRFEEDDDVQFVDGELCLAECMTEEQERRRDATSERMRRELESAE